MKKISNKQTKEDKQQQQQLNKPKKTKGENKQTNKSRHGFQLLKWKVLKQIKNKTNMARIVKKKNPPTAVICQLLYFSEFSIRFLSSYFITEF